MSQFKYSVVTDHPVALDSPDYLYPAGTMHDNSVNRKFNEKLYKLFGGRPISLVDVGCSGGGFVKSVLDDGHVAIGLEGSDYSITWDGPGGTAAEKERRKPGRRAEWATIPDNLFTCDVTHPFQIFVECPGVLSFVPIRAEFDVFTAWEVMEHIPEARLGQVIDNVLAHLKADGIWVMSVSTQYDGVHHQTVRSRQWWLDAFAQHGLENQQHLVEQFGDDWVRGPQQNAPGSFHLILKRKTT